MRTLRLLTAMLATTALFGLHNASAFTADDTTLGSPEKAQNFSDPDDKMPAGMMSLSGHASYMGDNGGNSSDPASQSYDYDPSSGQYILRHK